MTPAPQGASTNSKRGFVVGALALLVGIAAAVVVGSVVQTAESRFAGFTSNRGSLLEAGEVELRLVTGDDSGTGEAGPGSEFTELTIEATDMLPGQTVERCIVVGYSGSVDAVDLRLWARAEDPDTLSPFLDTEIEIGAGLAPDCSDFTLPVSGSTTWNGSLASLTDIAGSFADGLSIRDDTPSGTTATVRIALTLADDNRAQGQTSAFWLVFEVRP